MTEQQTTNPSLVNPSESKLISEVELLRILNIELATLSELRLEKNFPFIRLNRANRIYLWDDVVQWSKQHRDTS